MFDNQIKLINQLGFTELPIKHWHGREFLSKGKQYIDFASTNYLGFDFDPLLHQRGSEFAKQWGNISGWSRMEVDPEIYSQLETRIGLPLLVYGPGILYSGRLLQGLGAGACSVLSRAIFRDKYEGTRLAKYGAYFSIFITLIVPVTPILGGFLQEQFSWQANVIFLALYLVMTFFVVLFALQETSQHHHFQKLKNIVKQPLLF